MNRCQAEGHQAMGSAGVWGIHKSRPKESTSCPCPGWGVCSTLISTIHVTANTLIPGGQILENQTAVTSLTGGRVTGSCHLPMTGFSIPQKLIASSLYLPFICGKILYSSLPFYNISGIKFPMTSELYPLEK